MIFLGFFSFSWHKIVLLNRTAVGDILKKSSDHDTINNDNPENFNNTGVKGNA